jgi:hypothetical protein
MRIEVIGGMQIADHVVAGVEHRVGLVYDAASIRGFDGQLQVMHGLRDNRFRRGVRNQKMIRRRDDPRRSRGVGRGQRAGVERGRQPAVAV